MGININVPNQINQNTPLRPVRSGATAEPDYSVKYTPQDLTEAQQAQARENIGAGTSDFSGSYNDLTNKPTIPAAQIQSDWNQSDTTALDYIKNKPAISEDIVEDKTDVLTIYSDKETNYTFDNGQMLDIWRNGVHTKLGNVGDNVRNVGLARGKNILKFNGIFGTEFSDKSGHYTIVCPLESNFNTLLQGTYTGYANIFLYSSGYHINTAAGSKVFNMNNNSWQNIWSRSGDVVFVDKPMNNLGDGTQQSPTFPANYYVPKTRYNEFITKMETIYASSYIDVLKTKVIQYDFLSIDPDYNVSIVILPTLPLTMTDANNNTISGDFVAQNITIS